MEKIFKKIEYIFDMYFAWMFYNGNQQHRYYEFINKKYGHMKTQNSIGADMGGTYEYTQLEIPFKNEDIYETCISCGKKTETLKTTHIDFRTGYVEGAGQLCWQCYTGKSRSLITIDERTIIDTPNDQELGAKIRKQYWDSKK